MKLRVGDIEMDSEGGVEVHARRRGRAVRAHNVVVTHGPAPPPSPSAPPATTPTPRLLRTLSWLGFGGAAAVAVATLVALPLTSPLALALLIPVVGLTTGGLVARRAASQLDLERARRRAAREEALAGPVEAALRATPEPLTVEALVARVGAPEADVVRGLARLVEGGRATEDLDLDTGHFLYRWGSDRLDDQLPPAALDIRDRVARLQASEHPPNSHEGT